MPETIDLEVLKRIPIFQGFTDAECRQLADLATVTEFEPADVVVHQGQKSQDLWILLDGCCEVVKQLDGKNSKSETIELAVLEPYSCFGEMSFFHPAEHSASVRAKTAVRLLCLPRRRFDSLLEKHASAACKLACNTVVGLAARLREMNEWVAELEGRKPAGKLGAEWGELRRKVFDGWQL